MRTITMADGTAYPCTRCGAADGMLWLDIDYKGTVQEAAEMFSRPEKTAEITRDWDGNDQESYRGYTTLRRVGNLTGSMEIVLSREAGKDA